MKKSLETRMDEMSFHLNKAAELTNEWWQTRTDMGRSMQTMDEHTDFFVAVASEALRTERRYISRIRYHRNKAKRIIRRYEKSPLRVESFAEENVTPFPDIPNYTPFPESEPRN